MTFRNVLCVCVYVGVQIKQIVSRQAMIIGNVQEWILLPAPSHK